MNFMNISHNFLETCSYRYLQQLAKSLGLPSNVKKVHLMEMIYAKKHYGADRLASLVAHIKDQRKQIAKRRIIGKKRKKLQGMEISSTSNHSPSISSIPIRGWSPTCHISSSQPIRKYTNTNPLIPKPAVESDRVLRSYNNRSSGSNYINIEHVVRLVDGPNSVVKAHEKQRYLWDMQSQEYRPVKVADCLVQRQLRPDNAVTRLGQSDSNQRKRSLERWEEQWTSNTSSSVPRRRERILSGVYPLKPKQMHKFTTRAGICNQDGHFNAVNAVVQKTIRHHDTMLKNKITQTNIKKTPLFVRRTIQVKTVRNVYKRSTTGLQDTCAVSNSSTDSARESSSDVDTKIKSVRSFQDSFEDVALAENKSENECKSLEIFAERQTEMDCATSSAMKLVEINRAADFTKAQVESNSFIDFATAHREMNYTGNSEKTHTESDHPGNRKDTMPNSQAINRLTESSIRRMYVISRNNDATTDNKTRRTDNAYATSNLNRFKEFQHHITNPQKSNVDQRNDRYNKETLSEHTGTIDGKRNRNSILKPNIATESMNYMDNSKPVDVNQNSIVLDTDRNKNYPNMSALTDVYPENHVEVIMNELPETVNSTIYYHKKIRAEKVRTQRLSSLDQRPLEPLPHITDMFSKLNDSRFQHLMQPLYVDCGDNAMLAPPVRVQEKPTNKCQLESIYNLAGPKLEQPLDFHHVIATTATISVYTSHFTTTAAACKSSAGCSTCITLARRDRSHNTDVEPILRVNDCLRAEDERDAAVLDDGTGVESIEDALELISQDGDYMERIGMGVRTQCVLCDWTGPRSILEYHVGLEHGSEVTPRPLPYWVLAVSLERARRSTCELATHQDRIYVLSVDCVGAERFRAALKMLPKEGYPESFEKYGRLTVYNKTTGEPHIWEGSIQELNEENEIKELNVELADLGLVPEGGSLKYEHGQWVVDAPEGRGAVQVHVADIEIVVHVQIFN